MKNCRQKSRKGIIPLLCVVVFVVFCAIWSSPAYALDTDSDGMADDWEIAYGLNPYADDSGLDPDGDKFTNGREYQDQTDPTNPASHLVLPQVTGRIPDTGQTTSYTDTFGEDSDYLINEPSYIKMDAQANYLPDSATSWAMVRDNVTGLIWEIKQVSDGVADYTNPHDADNTYTWYDSNPETNGGDAGAPGDGTDTEDFINALNAETFGTFSDWRMPTIQELSSIVHSGVFEPAINTVYFPDTVSESSYWSSTISSSDTDSAWLIFFDYGAAYEDYKTSNSYNTYVRAVRAGQPRVSDHLLVNSDGTVTDRKTGLMWPSDLIPNAQWEAALNSAEKLSDCGYTDWRLPNLNELRSIVDYETYYPAIDENTFQSMSWFDNFFSSTSIALADYTDYAWYMDTSYGYFDALSKSGTCFVYAVRGGQSKVSGHLFISAPLQASFWAVGDTLPITWETQDIAGNVMIFLSRQGGKDGTFETIAASTENDGEFSWTVTAPISCNCVLKIEPIDDPSKGTSQGLFTIESETLPTAVLSGIPPSLTNQTSATLTVFGDFVASYKYKLDDGSYSSDIPVSTPIELTGLSDGIHSLSVIGRDAAGGQQPADNPTMVSWAVDATPPSTIAEPLGGFYASIQQVLLNATDGSGSGCSAIYYTLDGSDPTPDSSRYDGPISIDQNTTLKYFSQDYAGNNEPVQTQTYIIDTQKPSVAITNPIDGSSVKPLYYIQGTASDDGDDVSVELKITDGTYYLAKVQTMLTWSYSESWIPVLLENGSWVSEFINIWQDQTSYTISARATDRAGNISETTIHFTYGEQKTASTVICNLSRESIILGEPVTVTGQITPAPAAIGVGIDIILTPPGSDPKHRTTFADVQGNFSYDIACGVIDRAGMWTVSAAWTGDAASEGATSIGQPLDVVKAEAGISLDATSQAIKLGDPVTISGKFTPTPDCGGGLADIPLTLVVTGPAETVIVPVTTRDIWGHFLLENYTGLNGLGEWTIQAFFLENSAYLATTSNPIRIKVMETAGYAVIVQGKISNEEGLACHNKTTNSVYMKLTERGLLDEDIQYFNFDTAQSGVDAVPSKTAVSQAITTWARDKMNARPANLYVVLVDHGLEDQFFIYPDIITSADLDGWLDTLQAGLTGQAVNQEIITILGFCHSGSFIDELSGPNRVIVTSAAAGEVSYKGPLDNDGIRDGEYFVTEFFKTVSMGKSVKECFENAVKQTRIFTRTNRISSNAPYFDHSAQHPLLDDNADHVGTYELNNASGDGSLSDQLFIGVSSLTGNAPGDVSIHRVADTVFLADSQTAANLWATVDDDSRLSTIWVEIKPPGYSVVDSQASGQVEMDLPRYVGVYDAAEDRYEWNGLEGFTEPGTYQVFYFARDSVTGNISALMETRVYKNMAGNSAPQAFELLTPEADESVLTTTVLDWQSTTDPDGDGISYTVLLSGADASFADPIRIEALEYSTCLITPADGIQDLADYYWKVQAIDSYGAVTESAVRVFHTNNTNPVAGWIQGHIYDGLTGVSIEQTGVTAGSVQLASEGGYYLGILAPGNYAVTAEADGYGSLTYDDVQVPEGTILTRNFALTASGTVAPVFTPVAGTYAAVQHIELTCATPDAVIYYTTDGTDPTESSMRYESAIKVDASVNIKARAYKAGLAPSDAATADYTITLLPGDLTGNGMIDLADAVCAMQILTGITPAADVYIQTDVNQDAKIGLEEAVYIIRKVSR